MMAICAIAYNTFLESIRRLELILLLLFGTLLVFSNCYLSTNEQAITIITKFVNEQNYVEVNSPSGVWDTESMIDRNINSYLKASGMLFTEVVTLFIAIAICLFMIPAELASGAVLYILPKPVQRHEYILGKFLGAYMIVTSCWLIMGLELFTFFTIKDAAFDSYFLTTVFLLPLKYGILLALMIMLTTRMPAIIAGLLSLLIFLGGHVSSKLQDFYLDPEMALEGPLKYLAQYAYIIIPHLHPVFSGTIMDPNENVLETWRQVAEWAAYAVLYIGILMSFAILSFRRKSL